jgi:uncharacterized protein YdeI (YjbR/CyaY-like superfamily)
MDEQRLLFHTRSEFRNWLQRNYSRDESVWLIFEKGKDSKTVTPQEALEEALCFGWIDGQFKKFSESDDAKYIKLFSQRRKYSNWSERNRGLAEKLIQSGLMTEHGLKKIEEAQREGKWSSKKAKYTSESQIITLEAALEEYPEAYEKFKNYPPSGRKTLSSYFADAKKVETRVKRLTQIQNCPVKI